MGSACSGHDSLDNEGQGQSEPRKSTAANGAPVLPDEEVESRPPTPFSRPITAIVLQR